VEDALVQLPPVILDLDRTDIGRLRDSCIPTHWSFDRRVELNVESSGVDEAGIGTALPDKVGNHSQ
jgi:hypothetical protein